MGSGHRMTMGQDQAGHAPLNPPDAIPVSRRHLLAAARTAGIELRRGGRMWMYRASGSRDGWITAGETNFLASRHLGLLSTPPEAQ